MPSYLPFRALAPALVVVLPWLSAVPAPSALAPGQEVKRELAGGEAQVFLLDGKGGQPLLITLDQHGIDVILTLSDAAGMPLGSTNTATEREGTETWLIPAGAEGPYRLEVRPKEPQAPRGRYRLRLEELASVTAEDRRRIEAERLMTEAGLLLSAKTKESRRQALALYGEALAHWRGLGSQREEARTLFRLAVLHQALGEWQSMRDRLVEALPLFVSLGDRAREADVFTYIGLAEVGLSRPRDAIAWYDRSLEIRRARGDQWGEAVTSQNVCLARLYLAEWREAIPCYERILPLLAEVGVSEAEAFNGLGGAYSYLGEPAKARYYYTEAAKKKRTLQDKAGEAKMLSNLAVLLADQDALGEALGYYGQALEVVRELGDRDWEARILNNRGHAYLCLGEPRRALDLFNQALPIRRELGNRSGEMTTLHNLGAAQERLGQVAEALESYGQALRIAQEIEDRAGEASSLNYLAQGHLTAGDRNRAMELFTRAAVLHRELGNRFMLAFALQRTGEIEAGLGQQDRALTTLREALDLRRLLGDPAGQAEILASIASVERGLGRLDDAFVHAEEAIGLVESVRIAVGDPGLRASFLASRRLVFDLAIALRMDLDRKEPGQSHAEAALALSERARARSLLDMLREARTEIRQGISPELRERERNLAYQFGRNARLRRGASTEEERANLQRELYDLLAVADRLQDEIRRSNPRFAVLDLPPLDATGIRGLLDPGTLLLEYTLGDEKSYLWAVTPERVAGFELPDRLEIEAAARRAYEEVSKTGQRKVELRSLGRLLLGPVADLLHGRRLVIVADGALQYVPFAALPDPGDPAGNAPLVAGHEIVSLPSASVLEVQRRVLVGRPRAETGVAVLADPVFVPWDSRLRKPLGMPAPTPPKMGGMPRIQRLQASGREAEAIASLLPPGQVFTAVGLDASRSTALSGKLAKVRVVHFATHGWIDAETPRLSGLTLSMVDAQGQPQEGLLSLGDIYNLELSAELVVLSGCETALGREIRGEGLVGLTQGFLYAGAERVMASLWRVEDRATSELMSRFYRAMLQEKLPPAAALRSAQLAIRSDPRWQDPFYWAPFLVQGDWR